MIREEGKILLCRRAAGQNLEGFWEFPGGKVEAQETDQECLERELLEELGIKTKVTKLIAANTHQYENLTVTLLLYITRITSGTIMPTVHDRVEWVHPKSLLDWDLAPADIPLAKIIQSEESQ